MTTAKKTLGNFNEEMAKFQTVSISYLKSLEGNTDLPGFSNVQISEIFLAPQPSNPGRL